MPDDRQADGGLDLEADARGRVDLDRVAVAERELELVAHLLRAVADADDLEALAVARRDADDHVVDEGAGQPVEALVELGLRRPGDHDGAVLLRDVDARRQRRG